MPGGVHMRFFVKSSSAITEGEKSIRHPKKIEEKKEKKKKKSKGYLCGESASRAPVKLRI